MKTTSRTQIGGTLILRAERRFAHILAQWIWNLRLELGQTLSSSKQRTTECAAALTVEPAQACESAERRAANACGVLWTSPMGTAFLYSWLSRLGVYPAT
jgi:hypothetical protein